MNIRSIKGIKNEESVEKVNLNDALVIIKKAASNIIII